MGIDKGFILILFLGTKEKRKYTFFSVREIVLLPFGNHVRFVFILANKKQKALPLISLKVCGERNTEFHYTKKKSVLILNEN